MTVSPLDHRLWLDGVCSTLPILTASDSPAGCAGFGGPKIPLVTRRMTTMLVIILALLLALAACSGSDDLGTAADADPASSCEASAQQIVARFDTFLEPYTDLAPEEFLASELEDLADFQNDVAQTVVTVATDPNDNCTERDLEDEVALALEQYAGEGTLNQYLVSLVRQGVQVERRDVIVGPDDDLVAILETLGPGSSITFTEGVFTLDSSILVQGDLVLVGAGRDKTILGSTADTAAIVVLAGGTMVMNDFTVRHIGDLPASVVVAVDSSLELVNMAILGGVVDGEGGGGSGIVLTETDQATSVHVVAIDESVISNNGAAGIAVTGAFEPRILNSVIESNVQCGICFFDTAAGQVQSTTLQGNGVGVQASNQTAPELSLNMFVDNEFAGLLIEDESAAIVIANSFEGAETVAIDVQGTATAVVQRNTIGAHAVGISLRGTSVASVSDNTITDADVGILVGGSAVPVVFENLINSSQIAGMLHTESSGGEFVANRIQTQLGAGIVVEGAAEPKHIDVVVDGGLVGVVFREMAAGLLRGAILSDQQVGIETNDQTSPTIELSVVENALGAGVILGGQTTAVFRRNSITTPVAIGIQTSGESAPLIEGNLVAGAVTSMLVTEFSTPKIIDNTLTDQAFGIGVSDQAMPLVEGNEIKNATEGALSFEGESGGIVRNNTVTDAGVVGIWIAGTASPTLEANKLFAAVPKPDGQAGDEELPDDGESDDADDGTLDETADDGATDDGDTRSGAGLLYAEQASGTAIDNTLFGFVIGIQVSDQAAPNMTSNQVDGAGVGGVGILYGGDGAGTADGNLSINQQVGFQLSDIAAPQLTNNIVEDASVAAFLIQGQSIAELSGNSCLGGGVGIVVLEEAEPVLTNNACSIQ
ncbi:MAG: parallel beta-helix repeat protein [Acidimicrobiales bacterium]|jgi:parallel beta-helix repeat protein